jgi:hypothetical protein
VKLLVISAAALMAVSGLVIPAQASGAETVTAAQFLQHCQEAGELCKLQIWGEIRSLERSRTICLPGSLSMESGASRVRIVLQELLEGDPDTFKTMPYKSVIQQIVVFLWPCEAKS